MRIPVTQADWPTAFNKFAKYLGRHWPQGKLPLSESREITARLMGYHSLLDVANELVPGGLAEGSFRQASVNNAMALRALLQFQLRPELALPLIQRLPWVELTVGRSTIEYQQAQQLKAMGKLLVMDEAHRFYRRTSALFVDLFDRGEIPPFEFAVNSEGKIYKQSHFEQLLSRLEISQEVLSAIGFEGTVPEFIRTTILPLAWRPLNTVLKTVDYRQRVQWTTPYMVDVVATDCGRLLLKHQGVNGYYPAVWTESELEPVLMCLFTGGTIESTGLDGITVKEKPVRGDTFQAYGQTFIRAELWDSYRQHLDAPWVSSCWMDSVAVSQSNIPAGVIEPSILVEHEQILQWIKANHNLPQVIKRGQSDQFQRIFNTLFDGQYEDLKLLQEQGYLCCELYEGMTDEEVREAKQELSDEINLLRSMGSMVREFHPEVSPFFDDVALGMKYRDLEHIEYCAERTPDFLVGLFAQRLSTLTGASCQIKSVAHVLLSDVLTDAWPLERVNEAWRNGCELLSLFRHQNTGIRYLSDYAHYWHAQDSRYISHGQPANVIRRNIADVATEFRKYSMKIQSGAQLPATTHTEGIASNE